MFSEVWIEADNYESLENNIITVEHKCVLCEAELESKEALQEHFRKHANKEIDGRGKLLAKTVKRKPDKRDALCDICGTSFDTITATIRHRFKMHPNSPTKYYCSYCGMQFPLKTHRDSHTTSHDPKESKNTEEHKKCEECDIIFYNLKALNYHYRSIHKRLVQIFQPIATPPPSNKIKVNSMNDALSVYYCHICGVEYVVKFNLQQHLERVHSQEERESVPVDLIKCTTCSAYFCSKKAYDVHNTYHKPNDLYVTSEEQRLQTITKIDQDFDIRRVKPSVEKYLPKLDSELRPQKRRRISKEIDKFLEVTIKEEKKSDNEELRDNQDGSSDSESDIPLQQRLPAS